VLDVDEDDDEDDVEDVATGTVHPIPSSQMAVGSAVATPRREKASTNRSSCSGLIVTWLRMSRIRLRTS
jgi:hypothetical protein